MFGCEGFECKVRIFGIHSVVGLLKVVQFLDIVCGGLIITGAVSGGLAFWWLYFAGSVDWVPCAQGLELLKLVTFRNWYNKGLNWIVLSCFKFLFGA